MTEVVGPHEPAEMVYSHRGNRKYRHSTRRGIRYRNHWFRVYKCPVCGQAASHRRRPIICRGEAPARIIYSRDPEEGRNGADEEAGTRLVPLPVHPAAEDIVG